MPVRVLVVDDSRFFRKRIEEILKADSAIEVVGFAVNGQEAVDMAAQLSPDVITMDVEMPVMDGITAVRKIMQRRPMPILMFSSLTTDGAQSTLDALDAGALDFIPKKFEDISSDSEEAKELLRKRVKEIARKGHAINMRVARPAVTTSPRNTPTTSLSNSASPSSRTTRPLLKPSPAASATTSVIRSTPSRLEKSAVSTAARMRSGELNGIKLLAIGTSTGGPVALQSVLTALPATFPMPIVMVQHMPGTFTPAFAQRLNQICQIQVKEAQDGDALVPGHALVMFGLVFS